LGDHVLIGLGRLAEGLEAALDQRIVPFRPHPLETAALLLLRVIGDLQDLDG